MGDKFYIRTFGCQMNEKDSERMKGLLLAQGYAEAASPEEAEVILINTCSVREKPATKVFTELGRLKAEKEARPGVVLGVTGCVAQQLGEQLLNQVPHLDLVIGTQMIHRLPELLGRVREGERVVAVEWLPPEDDRLFLAPEVYAGHPVRAFVSIMQGCDNSCAYCIVPQVRGRAVSRRSSQVLAEVRDLVRQGVREVTLLGQNVNAYHDGELNFPELLKAVAEVPGLLRVRFTTSHPRDFSRELVETMAQHPRIMPHVHLPAQAGSDRVLKLMNRGYTRDQYLDLVHQLREAMSEIGITSDFIVGFPGETEEDFQETLRLLDEVQYDETFSFRYSIRPGTLAANFPDQVPEPEKYERLYQLQEKQRKITEARNQREVGRTHEVLIYGPSKTDPARQSGRTPQHRLVHLEAGQGRPGELISVRITRALKHSLLGEPLVPNTLKQTKREEETCLWR